MKKKLINKNEGIVNKLVKGEAELRKLWRKKIELDAKIAELDFKITYIKERAN